MRALQLILILFVSLNSFVEAGTQSAADDTMSVDSLVQLDYESFDQTKEHGWRALFADSDYAGAAQLIDRYVEKHVSLLPYQKIVLRFHSGQAYAFAGDYRAAMERFCEAVDTSGVMVDWNPYVEATIAFLERDTVRLAAICDSLNGVALARESGYPNLEVVQRFARYPDSSYAWAYRRAQSR